MIPSPTPMGDAGSLIPYCDNTVAMIVFVIGLAFGVVLTLATKR